MVQAPKLVRDEVERNDSIFEFIIFIKINALVAAACQNRVQNEDRKACNDKDGVLEQVDNKVGVKARSSRVSNHLTWLKAIFPEFSLFLDKEDGVGHDSGLDDPLADGPVGEAFVSARLLQEAVTESVVNAVEKTQAESHTPHLCHETQVDHQIVVEQVEDGEYDANRCKDKQLLIFVRQFLLQSDSV